VDELNKMVGGLGNQGAGSGADGIVGAFGNLVGGEGGLQNLVGQLSSSGLGEQVASWVGVGPNKTVEPAQLQSALGDQKVQQLAGQAGMSVEQFLPVLAAALPTVIDTMTHEGKVPQGDAAAGIDIGGLLEGLGSAASAGPSSPLAQLGNLFGGKS
jgi:uncharacterized protein YidB (DUF937 family)